jgi:riboflavin kinase/FMN adenylyltransferase
MRISHDLCNVNTEGETIVTVGAYDGLHRGHQEVLSRLTHRAVETKRLSAVVTFDPLPRAVLEPTGDTICLTTTEEKTSLLEQWGLDILVILPFTPHLARESAPVFVRQLRERLKMAELWVGSGFALGQGRQGDIRALRRLGRTMAFRVHVVSPIRHGDREISSTRIRGLLHRGYVRDAAQMLGRTYTLRTRWLGGPARAERTAASAVSLQILDRCVVPADGAYAVYAAVRDRWHSAIVNIRSHSGTETNQHDGELYLLDADGSLPAEPITLHFVEHLHDEHRLTDRDALDAQIRRDRVRAREILTPCRAMSK